MATSLSSTQTSVSSSSHPPPMAPSGLDEEDIDKFAILFSPATPRASPTLGPTTASDTSPSENPHPRPHPPEALESDSEFGSFVSVPATEDPLFSLNALDFELPSPVHTAPHSHSISDRPTTEAYGGASQKQERNSSLLFFDKFGHDARVAAEKNRRGVLDELLMHEDDPLYWLKDQEQVGPGPPANDLEAAPLRNHTSCRADEETKDAEPSSSASGSLFDLDPQFFTSGPTSHAHTETLSHSSQHAAHMPNVISPQSPTLPAPPTLAPPLADTSSSSSVPHFSDPLSQPKAPTELPRPLSAQHAASYQTLSSLSSRWMSSLLPSSPSSFKPSQHSTTPSLEALFAFDAAATASSPSRAAQQQRRAQSADRRTPTPTPTPAVHPQHPHSHSHQAPAFVPAPIISHGTPFHGPSRASPFASHIYHPPSGAPGFAGSAYDWDKGFSSELERELRVSGDDGGGDRVRDRELVGVLDHAAGVGEFMEKKSGNVELGGRRAATVAVLDVGLANMIRSYLPALARLPRTWTLLYSLDQHGISLNTLYARCEAQGRTRRPGRAIGGAAGALVVVKDAADAVFGVWMGEEGVHLSKGKGYYGSGESFLWKYVAGKFQVFKWTGKNDYVALCEPGFISFGGGDGHYGLYLNDTLFEGSTARCPTFDNDPLCSVVRPGAGAGAARAVDFECVGLEVWGVGP